MGKSFQHDEFWLTVLDFFINTGMIDKKHFAPVCDWIHQKKFVGIGDEPAQPNFTLKGRTMESILLHTENWHRVINRQRRISGTTIDFESKWEKCGLQDFAGGNEQERYTITEINKYGDLVEEGRALHHCVGSYYNSCKSGKCAIFSFKRNTQHTLTIEVEQRCVTQVRGRYNRYMNPNEKNWLLKWADMNNLSISKYVTEK